MKTMAMLFLAKLAVAQSSILTGSTFDAHHEPVAGVKVSLRQVGQKNLLTTQTDSAGAYRFAVPPGQYTLSAESKEMGEASAGPVTIDKATTVDLILQPAFFDEPQFVVAGVTDNTYRGGHGSDTVLRSSETLTKDTASLSEPHHTKAELEESSGHPLEAVKEFQRAAELNPSEVNLFDWGAELLSHRAPQAASEVFAKGAHRYPESARTLLGLATSYYAAGSYEQAAHCFFQATDLHPSEPNPYLFLAKVRAREITESSGYQERLARFAKLRPENAQANYYYAVTLWNRSQSKEAYPLLEEAIALDPHLALAYLQLGIIDAVEQRYSEAITAYQKAIAENSNLEEAHYRLSEAYRLTGDSLKSQRELATYRQLSQQSSEKLERERREIQQFVVELRNQ